MMQPDRSVYLTEAMAGDVPGHCSQWAQLDSLGFGSGNVVKVCKNANNNVSIQTGEEFSLKFLQECAASRIVAPVHSIVPSYEKSGVGVSDSQDHQIVYEEIARVLGLRRIDSECGSDVTEYASARGSMSKIDNGVTMSNESMQYMDIGFNGLKVNKSTVDVFNDQVTAIPNGPVLAESDTSRSLFSSRLGVSNGSQSGKIKLLCSFGGKILPRPSDGKLRYVGGETRMISIRKNNSWEELVKKTSGMCNQLHSIKYQLPGEDLDALISVSSDEDLQNMLDEYDGVENPDGSQRLRIFLIPLSESETLHAHDTNSVEPSNSDYQYVAAVNGIAEIAVNGAGGADPIPHSQYNGQLSAIEFGQLGPNDETNAKYEKIFPLPAQPVEVKDATGVPDLTALLDESQKLITPPSSNSVSAQKEDVNYAKTKINKNKPTLGSTDGLVVLSTALPIQPEDSICYTAHHHTPQLALNSINPQDPINKHDVIQTNEINPLVLNGGHLAPQGLKHNNGNFEPCSSGGVAFMGGAIGFESSHLQPGNLVEILPTSSDLVGCYQGIPHAFSDSNLQEQKHLSAYPSHEALSQSISLNLERPSLSWCRLSTELAEKSVELHEDVGFINTQPPAKALNGDPLIPVNAVSHLKAPSGFDPLSKLEIAGVTSYNAEKEQLSKEDLISQISRAKPHENECNSNFEGNDFFGINDSPAISNGLTMGLGNDNFEVFSHLCLNSPKQNSQSSRILAPAAISLNSLSDPELGQAQMIYPEQASSVMRKGDPESHSTLANNSVAGHVHASQEQSSDNRSYTDLINVLSNGLVSSVANPFQCFEGSRDVVGHDIRAREHSDLDQSSGVSNASGRETTQNPILVKREVSLLDDDFSNYSDNMVNNSDCVRIVKQHQKAQDGEVVGHIKQSPQEHGPFAENASYNLLPAKSFPTPVSDVSGAANGEIFTAPAHEAHGNSEDINADSNEDGLFSDAMIAEMEADLYGLQIIKNADLEDVRELGSGTYGTVFFGKWRGTDVAIKRIKKACFSGRSSEQARLTKDFWREARILSNLHHPNVVAFYGVVPDGAGGTLATVTEFMANGSLRTALIKKDKLLDHRKKLIIAMDAAFGMEYLHSKNIVHFDLKCDNLLVNLRDPQRPICKVGDFGLSKIKRNTLVSGGVRGTLPWMAPELLNGSTTQVSEKVDVFSFGIVLWEILTGEEPYANMHCGAIIGGIVKNTLRPPIPERCDPEWRNLMEQCWSANPDARPSFTEITYRLRSIHAALDCPQTNPVRNRTNP